MKNIFTILVYFVIAIAGFSLAYSGAGPLDFSIVQPGSTQLFGLQQDADFTWQGDCQFNRTRFTFTGPQVDTIFWDFGDTAPGVTGDTSRLRNPSYTYTEEGTFEVRVRYVINNVPDTITKSITIRPAPVVDFGKEDTILCKGETIELVWGEPREGLTYLWYPGGETTPTIMVDSANCYSVTVTDPVTGCSNSDRIFVSICGEDRSESAKWFFGNGAGLDFEEGDPTPLEGSVMNAPGATGIGVDRTGQLQFYTDGRTVYTSEHGIMQNGQNLNGNPSIAQGAIVVPQPADCKNCPSFYYIFHIGEDNIMYYSKVDMRLDGGNGAVIDTLKNIPLFDNSEGRVTAVENPSDSTFWLVGRQAGAFVSFHITKDGLQVEPLTTNLGSAGTGYMKANAEGDRLAVTTATGVEIFAYNDSLGTITGPPVVIDLSDEDGLTAYGIEFSADGSKLYISLAGPPSRILQYDLSNYIQDTIATTRYVVSDTSAHYGALQRGTNGKIYVAINGSPNLGVINDPDQVGAAVGYQVNLDLQGATSTLGLPNFVNSFTEQSGGPGISMTGVCTGEPTVFRASPTCPPRTETFNWQLFGLDGAVLASGQGDSIVYTYTQPGQYRVLLDIRHECTPENDTIIEQQFTIYRNPEPVTITNTAEPCAEVGQLDAGANIPEAFYLWSNGMTGRTITVSESGSYEVIVINMESQGECFQTDQFELNLTPLTVNLPPDTVVCQGQSITLDAGTQPAGATFQWNPGNATSQSITVQPGETTQYTVTVTDPATGCVATDAITVNVVQAPSVNYIVENVSACNAQDGNILLQGTPGPGLTFLWSGPSVTDANRADPELNGVLPGAYSVIIFNQAGCSDTLSFSVNVDDYNPGFTAESVTADCNGRGRVVVSPDAAAGTTFTWIRSGGGIRKSSPENFLVDTVGVYSVEIREPGFENCPFTISNIEIRPNPNQPTANVNGRLTNCGEYTLEVTNLNTQQFSYEWGPAGVIENVPGRPGVGVVRTPNTRVNLTVRSIQDPACQVIIPADVPDFPAPPQVSVSSARNQACEGDFIELQAVVGPGRYTYEWQSLNNAATIPGPTNQRTVRVNASGQYRVIVRDQNTGCSTTATSEQVTFIAPPVANAGQDQTICLGQTARLEATLVENATYRWSNGQTSRVITVNPQQTTTYTVTVTRAGLCSSTDEVIVNVAPIPAANLGPDVEVCANTPPTLDARNAANPADVSYAWSFNGSPIAGVTTPTLLANQSGRYEVTITRGNCPASDEVVVTLIPSPTPVIGEDTLNICVGDDEVARLDAGTNPNYTYFWPQLGANTPQVDVTTEGIYTVQVTNAQGCTESFEFLVQNLCEPRVFVPQAFSPNGDGSNDVLQIFGNYTGNFEMLIYNRWGEIVFATNSFNDSWDGTYKGTPVPIGTYAWTINYTSEFYPERPATQVRGAVMLVR